MLGYPSKWVKDSSGLPVNFTGRGYPVIQVNFTSFTDVFRHA